MFAIKGFLVGERRTGVCIPVVFVVWAFLFADEFLVEDFCELHHYGFVVLFTSEEVSRRGRSLELVCGALVMLVAVVVAKDL